MCCTKHPAPQGSFDWKSFTEGASQQQINSAEPMNEAELNKLAMYLSKNELWTYCLLVQLVMVLNLPLNVLVRITWGDVLKKSHLHIWHPKTNRLRKIAINQELLETLSPIYLKLRKPRLDSVLIPQSPRMVSKSLSVHAVKAGLMGFNNNRHETSESVNHPLKHSIYCPTRKSLNPVLF